MGTVIRFRRPRRKARRLRGKVVTALIAAVLAGFGIAVGGHISTGSTGVSTSASGEFRLCGRTNQQTCVVDGDTIHYRGVKIRLSDIDAPEISEPKCSSEAALGKQATDRLLEMMNGGSFEIVHRTGPDEDRYGRKLRVIERDGKSVGDTLIAEGLARRWDGARRSWCS